MGGKTSTSTSQVTIPPEVLARYNAVNAQAQAVAQTPFQQYSNNPNAFVAPLTPTQQAGILATDQYAECPMARKAVLMVHNCLIALMAVPYKEFPA